MNNEHTICITFCDGGLNGLKIVRKSDWNGVGLVFPKTLFSPNVRNRSEMSRSGIYILVHPSEEDSPLPTIYVGQADVLRGRLAFHSSGGDWITCYAFTSDGDDLNSAHSKYLESMLVSSARKAAKCKLVNGNSPNAPNLSLSDKRLVEDYYNELVLTLSALGMEYFVPAHTRKRAVRLTNLFSLDKRECKATGRLAEDGKSFFVLKDSRASKSETESCPKAAQKKRVVLISRRILKDAGESYRFTQEFEFSSPSAAASVVLGSSANGRAEWRDANGLSLNDWIAKKNEKAKKRSKSASR